MKVIKILFLFIFLLSCSFCKVVAQTTFLKGYYITHQQDTIQGYIDYHAEQRNFYVCVFRKELNSHSIRLYPNDISRFAVDDKVFYETRSFKSKKKKTDEPVYGFFKVIVAGKLSLLQYKARFFAKNETNEIFEITKNKEQIEYKIIYDYYGQGILKVLMKDCPEVMNTLLEREFKINPDFTNIFITYYECTGQKYSQTKEIKLKPQFDFGLQASAMATDFRMTSTLSQARFETDFTVGYGGFTSVFLPSLSDQIRLVMEIAYGKYSNYAYFSTVESNNDLFIDYSFLKAPLLIRYSPNRFFIEAGLQNHFILDQNNRWRIESIQQNIITTRPGDVPQLNNYNMGYAVGGGINYTLSNLSLRTSLRFSKNQLLSHTYQPVIQSVEFLFSLQFK